MTPMLTRIEQQLAQCADPDRRAELQAERASYLARTGHFAEANEILAALRKAYGDGRNARVSVWIMFVEGLVLYFESLDPAARDRLLRARLISAATRFDEMTSLTEAWLAHIEFNRSDFASTLHHLRRWSDLCVDLEGSSGLRFCLVVADALMHCGEIVSAKLWYEKTRLQAVRLGDETSLAAMIYNKAAIGLGRLRIESARGSVDSELVKFVSMEIASARNFHYGAGHKALPQIIEACSARILLLQCRFEEALPIFSSLIENSKLRLGLRSDRALLLVEYALCLAQLGNLEKSHALLGDIQAIEYNEMTSDDQFIFFRTCTLLSEELSLSTLALECNLLAERYRERLDAEMLILKQGLSEILKNWV